MKIDAAPGTPNREVVQHRPNYLPGPRHCNQSRPTHDEVRALEEL